MNDEGRFDDVSLVSGIDFTEDGRGFAFGDFDMDGIQELGIVSNQSPQFRIATTNDTSGSQDNPARWASVELVGGNFTATPNPKLSSRDPVGAILIVKTASATRMFQVSRGEGFSVQNSRNIHIGLGEDSKIDELKIRWPSGGITVEKDIMAGSRVKFRETEN